VWLSGKPPDARHPAPCWPGIRTGQAVRRGESSIVYIFNSRDVIATLLMLPTGLLIGRYAFRFIVTVPKAVLVPTVAFMTIIGTYAIRNNMSDVVIMLGLGVGGWVLDRCGFKPSPIVLGLILSRTRAGFVQAEINGTARARGGEFLARPIPRDHRLHRVSCSTR
jgi:putative tricarboxylic transport membrane protein